MTSLYTATKHPEQLEATPLIEESHHYDDPLEPQKLVFLDAVNKQRCVITHHSVIANSLIQYLYLSCY